MSDIKGSIFKITNAITKTSGELLKNTKLSLNLSTEEERLKAIYIEIGKKVHEIYQYGGSLGKAFDEKYAEIVKQEEKIQKLRQQMDINKGTKSCPKCSSQMDRNAEFCSKCGYRANSAELEALPHVDDTHDIGTSDKEIFENPEPFTSEPVPVLQVTEEHKSVKTCRACGKECSDGDKFCLYCGRML